MNKFIAQAISSILNPIVILAIFPYILVFKYTGSSSSAFFWTIFSWVFILIFGLFFFIGLEKKYFSDIDVSKRRQRPLLYSFSIALSSIYIILLYILKAPEILFIAIFGLIVGLICMEFINKVTKASVHIATLSAFTTGIVLGFGPIFILSFILIPVLGWARIVTHNHTKRQVIIGATMGILITLCVYVIFKFIV